MTTSPAPRAAIIGSGQTEYSRGSGRSEWQLANEAIGAAIQDAGLEPRDIDGLVRFSYDHVDEAMVVRSFGMTLSYYTATNYGGLGAPATVGAAAAAIAAGQARAVVCFRSLNGYSETRYGRAERSLGQSHGPVVASGDRSPSGAFAGPYGLLAPGQVMASWAHRYCYQYGLTVDQLKTALGRIAIDQRQYAHTNPAALMKDKPLDFATYLRARPIADPLGLFDFALETDGAAAVVVAAADIARDSKRTAWVRGAIQGLLPFSESVSIYGDLRNAPAYRRIGARLFQQAGLTPSDISVAMLYDATTVTTLLAMETFGLAPEGQAWRVLTDQGLGPSCPLPINTNGGHLSEAYIHGLNLVVEAARQCWGTSPNQIADVKAVLCTSGPTGLILSPE